jgi:hypothetical protein
VIPRDMQLPRPVLFAALAPIALAACYRGGASGGTIENRTQEARTTAAAGDELAFLPLDSEIVIGLDARQILASPLWKHAGPRLMTELGKGLQDFRAACGYDPVATLRGVTMGLKARTPLDGVFVVRGLPRDKTMACITRAIPRRAAITVEGGVITVPSDGPDDPPAVMAFAGPTTLVIATSRAELGAALSSGAPLRRSRAFSELWALVDAKRAMWAIVNGSSSAFDGFSRFGVRPRALLGSVALADGLSLTGRMRLATPDEATRLASLAQPQLGAAQGMADKIEVGADGTDVTLRVDLTTAQVDTLVGLALPMVRP